MKTKKFTAICFNGTLFIKYRNIANNENSINRFEKYCAGKNIAYINYYDANTRQFVIRNYKQPAGNYEPK